MASRDLYMNKNVSLELLEALHKTCVLVVGDVMLDRFIYGSVERISPEAPIPVLSVERTANMLGGSANVARNVATLGATCILVGCIGQDADGVAIRQELLSIPSIDARLTVDETRPTTVKTRHVADGQQILRADVESIARIEGEVAARVIEDVSEALPSVSAVIFSDYAKGVLSDHVLRELLTRSREAGKPVLVDPKSRSFERYRGASVLTPNRSELQLAHGHECLSDDEITAAARAVVNQGICNAVVVTRGKDGMSIVERGGEVTHLRAAAREVFDVSGAGDTAMAAMSLAIAAGGTLTEAANIANVAAGIVVGKYGTAAVTCGEIVATLEETERGVGGSKSFTRASVLQRVARWRDHGLRIAFTNGCFDLLHPGHVSLLEQARKAADRLVVALNSDLSVRQLKGINRPIQSELARATVLASLKAVDAVVIFDELTPLSLIEALEPDVLVKGADYKLKDVVGADFVVARGGTVLLADIVPAHSTTSTVNRITGTPKGY